MLDLNHIWSSAVVVVQGTAAPWMRETGPNYAKDCGYESTSSLVSTAPRFYHFLDFPRDKRPHYLGMSHGFLQNFLSSFDFKRKTLGMLTYEHS